MDIYETVNLFSFYLVFLKYQVVNGAKYIDIENNLLRFENEFQPFEAVESNYLGGHEGEKKLD